MFGLNSSRLERESSHRGRVCVFGSFWFKPKSRCGLTECESRGRTVGLHLCNIVKSWVKSMILHTAWGTAYILTGHMLRRKKSREKTLGKYKGIQLWQMCLMVSSSQVNGETEAATLGFKHDRIWCHALFFSRLCVLSQEINPVCAEIFSPYDFEPERSYERSAV